MAESQHCPLLISAFGHHGAASSRSPRPAAIAATCVRGAVDLKAVGMTGTGSVSSTSRVWCRSVDAATPSQIRFVVGCGYGFSESGGYLYRAQHLLRHEYERGKLVVNEVDVLTCREVR